MAKTLVDAKAAKAAVEAERMVSQETLRRIAVLSERIKELETEQDGLKMQVAQDLRDDVHIEPGDYTAFVKEGRFHVPFKDLVIQLFKMLTPSGREKFGHGDTWEQAEASLKNTFEKGNGNFSVTVRRTAS